MHGTLYIFICDIHFHLELPMLFENQFLSAPYLTWHKVSGISKHFWRFFFLFLADRCPEEEQRGSRPEAVPQV